MFLAFWRFRRSMAPHAWALAGGVVLVVMAAVMQVALPWPLKVIIDNVLKTSDSSGKNGLLQAFGADGLDRLQLLTVALAGLLVFTLVNAGATYLGSRLLNLDPPIEIGI